MEVRVLSLRPLGPLDLWGDHPPYKWDKARFDPLADYHSRPIRLVAWAFGFHPEGKSSILLWGTKRAASWRRPRPSIQRPVSSILTPRTILTQEAEL